MRNLLFLLIVAAMLSTACESNDVGNDINPPHEQPGGGNNDEGQIESPIFILDGDDNIIVDANGGEVIITLATNLEYTVDIPEEAQSWLSVADTRALRSDTITFIIAKNETESERSAVVTFTYGNDKNTESITISQNGTPIEEDPTEKIENIEFQDDNVKLICTLHWDTNEDGELSYEEAAAVTDIGTAFMKSAISTFMEFEHFTGVKNLAFQAFYNCSSLVRIALPEQLATIDSYAFSYCTNLKKIVIPDSVTSIGERVFMSCSSLTDVTIGGGITEIPPFSFSSCSSLTNINIPNKVTKVGESAFCYCSSLPAVDNVRYADTYVVEAVDTTLASYTLTDNARFIGTGAFSGCSDMTSINMPDGVISIGRYAFNNCQNLVAISIGNSLTTIGEAAFEYCSSLVSINIPDSITLIGQHAFNHCSNLTNVIMGDVSLSIEERAFSYCTSLKSVILGDGTVSIGNGVFDNCSSLECIDLPDSVTAIGDEAFDHCSKLEAIAIGNCLTSIGNNAFSHCSSLKNITIPDSVTTIGTSAFGYCSSLERVYCLPKTPPTVVYDGVVIFDKHWGAFDHNSSERIIQVPSESLEIYKSAEGWSEYADYIFGYNF